VNFADLTPREQEVICARIHRYLGSNGDTVAGVISRDTATESAIVAAALDAMLAESPPRIERIKTKFAPKFRALAQVIRPR